MSVIRWMFIYKITHSVHTRGGDLIDVTTLFFLTTSLERFTCDVFITFLTRIEGLRAAGLRVQEQLRIGEASRLNQ